MRRLLAIGLGLFTYFSVAACAHHLDTAYAQSVRWNLFVAGDQAKLAYGQPNSDLAGLILSCDRGAGTVLVSGDVPADRPVMVLASGERRLKLEGDATPDPFTGGLYLEAKASAGDPALQRFARTGDLNLVRPLNDLEMRAAAPERGDIRRFFAHCEA